MGFKPRPPKGLTAISLAVARLARAHMSPKPQPEREGWTPIDELDLPALGAPYNADALRIFELRVDALGPPAERHKLRYTNARKLIASWINHAQDVEGNPLNGHVFDIWCGQRHERGVYQPSMLIGFASARSLPDTSVFDKLRKHRAFVSESQGRHPVEEGIFPDLQVSNGVVSHCWSLSRENLLSASRVYRNLHGLPAQTRDPYAQMLSGAEEPLDFLWARTGRERPAREHVPSDLLDETDVPLPINDWGSILLFAETYLGFEDYATIADAEDAIERVYDAWSERNALEDEFGIDELRSVAAMIVANGRHDPEEETRGEFLRQIIFSIRLIREREG